MYRPFALLFLLVALGSQFPASSQTSSRLIEKTISRVDTQAAFQFQESSEYQYSDGRGSDMKTHAYHFDTSWTESDQRGNYTQRAIKFYYPDQRLREVIMQRVENAQWVNYQRQRFYYHGVESLDSLIEQHWNGFNRVWGNYAATRYHYNSQGQLLEEVRQAWDLSAYIAQARTEYSYGAGGNLATVTSYVYDFIGQQWTALEKKENSYSGGQLLREEWSRWDSAALGFAPYRAMEYRWTATAQVDSSMEWQWDPLNQSWSPRYLHCFGYTPGQGESADTMFHYNQGLGGWQPGHLRLQSYDTSGNLVEKTEYLHLGGAWTPRYQWTWTYNTFDQPLNESAWIWESSAQIWEPRPGLNARIEYKYELYNPVGLSTIPRAHPFTLYPNPARRQLNLEIPAEVSGKLRAQLLDMQGRTIKRWELNAKNTLKTQLDLDSIAPGQYLFYIRIGKDEYHQKITIQY